MEKTIIAGPCALESREQLRACLKVLNAHGVRGMRASLWKPRTRPGWEGLGAEALSFFLEQTLAVGVTPATEIMHAEHAIEVLKALEPYGSKARMLVWLGSRNQNHLEQKKIAQILTKGPDGLSLMFKNQMWDDENHWLGICEHILSAGFPKDRLLACHRGFAPGKSFNPNGYRNMPDFEMAMRVKEKTGLPMLLDPSHIGGSSQKVMAVCQLAESFAFDGYFIEMHAGPHEPKTDSRQQLSPEQFEELLHRLKITCRCMK